MKTVLIASHSLFMRKSLKIILKKCEFEILGEAENELSAIKMYVEFGPNVVIVDLTSSKFNGIETLKIIKEIDKRAVVIVILSSASKKEVKEAVALGAVSFIVKPFKEKTVSDTFKNIQNSL